MKKIFLFLFTVVLFFSLSLSVLAAESYIYTFPSFPSNWDGSDPSPLWVDFIPSPGNYYYELDLVFYNELYHYSGVCSVNSFFEDGMLLTVLPFSFSEINRSFIFNLIFIDLGDGFICLPTSENGDVILYFSGSVLTLKKIESAGFINSINSSLNSVLSWINSFSSAFMSGPLLPLSIVFLIGISIALLFFAIRFIRKVCWGC